MKREYIDNEEIMSNDTIEMEHIVTAKRIENNIVLFQNVIASFSGVKLTDGKGPNDPDEDAFCEFKYKDDKFYYRDSLTKEFEEVTYAFWTNTLLYYVSEGHSIHYFNED